jgi:hypothetical protein
MNSSVLAFLLQNPSLFVSTFVIQPLGIAAILYGIVWWILRPKAAKGTIQARYHWLGILATVLGWSLIRVVAIATFAGRSALTYDSSFSMVAYFIVPPAIVATVYVRWLLSSKYSAAIHKKLANELPPIVLAAADGDDIKVGSLVSSGTSPDAAGLEGQTGLMLAARNGHNSTVALLLSLGASPHAKSKVGNTARDIAAKFGHTEIEQLLQRATDGERTGVSS